MVKPLEVPADGQSLKKALHEKIEQLNEHKLSLLNRVVLQLEAEEIAQELDNSFDQDRREGRLASERVQRILSEVRAKHGYAP